MDMCSIFWFMTLVAVFSSCFLEDNYPSLGNEVAIIFGILGCLCSDMVNFSRRDEVRSKITVSPY